MEIMNKFKKIILADKERSILLFLALLIFIINIRYVGAIEIFSVLDDEFGYWGNAAYLAGFDWSGVMFENPYYSYGYSLLLVPLFFIFDNPVHMYKVAIILNGILLSASFLLCYDIARKIAKGIDKKILVVIAFLISMYPAYIVYSSIAWGECLLIFTVWLLTWCFVDLNETSSNYKFMLIGFLSVYLYMIHQRSLGVLIASIIVILFMKLLQKINLKQVLLTVLPIVMLMIIHVYLKGDIQTHLWLNSTGNMTNDYLAQASKINQIFSIDGLIALAKASMGHIFYLGAASYLLAYFGLYELLQRAGKATITAIRERKLDILSRDQYFPFYIFLLMVVLFSLAINIIFMINPTRIDHIVYGRYIDMIMGPVILLGFVNITNAIMNNRTNANKIFGVISVGFIFLTIAVKLIIDSSGLTTFHTVHAVGLFLINTPLSVFLPALIAVLVCRFIIISLKKKDNKLIIISFIVISFCFFVTGDNVAKIAVDDHTAKEIIDVVEFIEDAEENMPVYFLWDDQENPEYGRWDNRNTKYRLISSHYQFLLKDIPVKLVNEKELESIDDNKFVLTAGDKYSSYLEKDYKFCLGNRYSYLFVSKTSDLAND